MVRGYICLFRAINVGGKHPLAMKPLCALLQSLGLQQVRSYIQSGNVVFRSDRPATELAHEIAEAVVCEFGFRPQLLVLEQGEFNSAVRRIPFERGKALHLFFLLAPAIVPDLQRLDALRSASEGIALTGRVFYLYAPDGIGRSRLVSQLEKALGVEVTGRNWNTVERLQVMVAETGGGL